ncbi:dual oxidase 1-like, partial [Lingula anatina]|uniref:Dual oxidase 1-like n=1 Tax=Lingula anatina TaxID=7574 RepID=A0A1S3HSJ7_LINAN
MFPQLRTGIHILTTYITVEKLRSVYNGSMEHLDVFAGGMAETGRFGPGPLFREILLDQFLRIRDADRYWFENKQNGLFTDDEIAFIKSIKFADIITNVTNIQPDWLQRDVFLWQQGDPCPQEKQLVTEDMEPCTDLQGWDYFAGSELWFIGSLVVLGLVPFFCILVAYLIYRVKKFRTKRVKRTLHMDKLRSMVRANAGNIAATEWTDPKDLPRSIELHFDDMTCGLLVLTASGTKIRHLDFSMSEEVNVWLSMNRGKETMLIQIPNEYDLVVMFEDEEDRMEFLRKFKSYLNDFNKNLQFFHDKQQNILENAVTKRKRQQLLERFFKTVFAE